MVMFWNLCSMNGIDEYCDIYCSIFFTRKSSKTVHLFMHILLTFYIRYP